MAITETERPVPDRPIDPPFALVYDVVRRAARERDAGREEMRERLDATHERYTGLGADAAVALHELRGCLEGDTAPAVLTSVARRFATALDRAGVRFDDPVGEAYAAVGRRVDVAHAPDTGDENTMIVAKTLRPGVLLDDGEVIRRAQVVLGFVPTPAQREDAASARGDRHAGETAPPPPPPTADAAPERPEAAAEKPTPPAKSGRSRNKPGRNRRAARTSEPTTPTPARDDPAAREPRHPGTEPNPFEATSPDATSPDADGDSSTTEGGSTR